MLAPVDPGLPRAERVAVFVSRRVQALEAMAPVAKAARLREPFSDQLRANRDGLKQHFRVCIEESFSPDLEALPRRQREDFVEAVLAIGSFSTWYALREEQRLDVRAAERVLRLMVECLVAGGGAM
jgi:TetR/AcrR family transcriptional regulator of autoinduction and epiphytic fitness